MKNKAQKYKSQLTMDNGRWTVFQKPACQPISFTSHTPPDAHSSRDGPARYPDVEIMAEFKPALEKYYYKPTRYKTYPEQLGITYPTVNDARRARIKELEVKALEAKEK